MAKGPGQPVLKAEAPSPQASDTGQERILEKNHLKVARGPIQPQTQYQVDIHTDAVNTTVQKSNKHKTKKQTKTQISKLGEGYGQHRAREQHFFAHLPPSIPGPQIASCFNRKLFSLFSCGCHYRHVLNTFPKGGSILLYIWLQIEMLAPFFFTQLIFESLATDCI